MQHSARITVHNPATGDRVDEVTSASADDVAAAVAQARDAQAAWAATPMHDRVKVLRRFHDLVTDRADAILDTIQSESGKSRRDAMTEIAVVSGTARYYAAHGPSHLREQRAQPGAPLITRARVQHVPRGVVGMITPWNYPFIMSVADALPALLAGNAVVTKPSELTPLSAELARTLLIEAGLPAPLFQLVHGRGADTAQALIAQVDYVGFTGSTATGRKVAVSCAERLIPYSLELGGKNAMIVLEDANIDNAVWGALNGVFPNSGQSCISTERLLVHDRIYDQFVTALQQRTQALTLGWSQDWNVDMGSLISTHHASSVAAAVSQAQELGARAIVGGEIRTDLGDSFFAPTLLEGVAADMPLYDSEVFGPVAAIERISGSDHAIELVNASQYGLHSVVWGGSQRAAHDVARQLNTGSVGINATLLIYATPGVPMGGVKASGIGRRHAGEGILRYTNTRSIVRSVGWKGGYESITHALTSERRARSLINALKVWNRLPGVR